MPTIASKYRRNGVTNPRAASGTGLGLATWSLGTGEVGTTTYITGAVDGPIPEITSYLRRTTTTAKTSGSTGFMSATSQYRAYGSYGVLGQSCNVSVYVRSSVSTFISMRATGYNAAGASTNSTDRSNIALPANTWVRIDSTVLPSADFSSIGWWAYQTSAYILPVGSTFDLTGCLSEVDATVPGVYFDGDTPMVTDPFYSPPATITNYWETGAHNGPSIQTTAVPLQDYQVFMSDSTVLGAQTSVGLLEVQGLRGSGQMRSLDQDRAGVDGMAPSVSLLTGRSINTRWLIADKAGTEGSLQKLTRNWQNITDPSTVLMTARDYLMQLASTTGSKPISALRFQLPGRSVPIIAFGKPGALNPPVDSNYQFGFVEVTSEWNVPDGKLYDDVLNYSTVSMPLSLGGAAFPWTFPVNFGPSTGGLLMAKNDGMYPAYPVLQIIGPVTNPRIVAPTGQFIRVNITLQAGDIMVIDCDSHVVRVNGANRNNLVDVGSSFFTIPPGGSSLAFASTDNGYVMGTAAVYTLNTYSTI